MAFTLPELPYDYHKLEPHIDAWTMEIHHGKHHAGYTKKLNAAIEGTDLAGKDIVDILKNLDMDNGAVRNNGGGFYNHSLFWSVMSPDGGGKPDGDLAAAIDAACGSQRREQDLAQDGLGYVLIQAAKLKFVLLQTKTIH